MVNYVELCRLSSDDVLSEDVAWSLLNAKSFCWKMKNFTALAGCPSQDGSVETRGWHARQACLIISIKDLSNSKPSLQAQSIIFLFQWGVLVKLIFLT